MALFKLLSVAYSGENVTGHIEGCYNCLLCVQYQVLTNGMGLIAVHTLDFLLCWKLLANSADFSSERKL